MQTLGIFSATFFPKYYYYSILGRSSRYSSTRILIAISNKNMVIYLEPVVDINSKTTVDSINAWQTICSVRWVPALCFGIRVT